MPSNVPVTPILGLFIPPFDYSGIPNWQALYNQNMEVLDNLGQPVGSSDINIDAALLFNNWPATELEYIQFNALPSLSPLAAVYGSLYDYGGNMYWTDGAGNQIQMTSGGSPVGGPSNNGFSGTYGGAVIASVTAGTYSFFQALNSYAPLKIGPLTIFDPTASTTSAVNLTAYAGAPAYSLKFPSQAPSSTSGATPTKFLMTDTSGQLSFQSAGSGLSVSGGSVAVSGLGFSNLTAPTIVNPSLGSGWTANTTVAYFIDVNQVVHLSGSVIYNGGSTLIFTLGSGYIPSAFRGFPAARNTFLGGGIVSQIAIDTSGDVACTDDTLLSGQTIYLDGITFSILT